MENQNRIKMDDKFVYSASGKAYLRRAPRGPHELSHRRFPHVKTATGGNNQRYNYFTGHPGVDRVRLPAFDDPGFDPAFA